MLAHGVKGYKRTSHYNQNCMGHGGCPRSPRAWGGGCLGEEPLSTSCTSLWRLMSNYINRICGCAKEE